MLVSHDMAFHKEETFTQDTLSVFVNSALV